MTDTETVGEIRDLSKLLFGNRLRLEVAAAIASEPDGLVYARGLAERLTINDNQAAAELKTFESAGLLERAPKEHGGRAIFYRRLPSTYWDAASTFFEEASARHDPGAGTTRREHLTAVHPGVKSAASRGVKGRSPLLRLQSDERLVALIRQGNRHAFEVLVGRYESRLRDFCHLMLSSKEDADEVLQDVFAAALKAILADDRRINVRPWLYRLARHRSLDRLRRMQVVGTGSVGAHLPDGGVTAADEASRHEESRFLIADVQHLPEMQRTALLLREIDGLSYAQIAEALDTTVPSVKSSLVRARVSLLEAEDAP